MRHFVRTLITYDAVYGETLEIAGILHGLIIYVDCINSNLYCINPSMLLMGHTPTLLCGHIYIVSLPSRLLFQLNKASPTNRGLALAVLLAADTSAAELW